MSWFEIGLIIILLLLVGILVIYGISFSSRWKKSSTATAGATSPAATTTPVSASTPAAATKPIKLVFSWWYWGLLTLLMGWMMYGNNLVTIDNLFWAAVVGAILSIILATIVNWYKDNKTVWEKHRLIFGAVVVIGLGILLWRNDWSISNVPTDIENLTGIDAVGGAIFPGIKLQKNQQPLTVTKFIGEAHGETYTITDDVWSVFAWPDHFCTRFKGGVGLETKSDKVQNTLLVKAPTGSAPQQIQVNVFPVGTTWGGYHCEYN